MPVDSASKILDTWRCPISRTIKVFEPALCCNTGVCGPDVDEALVRFTADLAHLQERGVAISRHNLANDPGAFAADATVAGFLRIAGSAGLPLVLVDGVTVATGHYPDRDELTRFAGIETASAPEPQLVTVAAVSGPATNPAGRADLGLSAVSAHANASSCCGGGADASGSGCC